METGPLAIWLWNALAAKGLPIVVLDARHASAALKMMPNKTDRHDARGLAQIVRTGWYKEVRIKSHGAYVIRALLTARDALVGIRVRLENESRGLLKTFGVMFGKRVGGFMRRAEEIIAEELTIAPELRPTSKRWSRRGAPSWNASECSTPSCARPPARAASSACS
jgi:transposase